MTSLPIKINMKSDLVDVFGLKRQVIDLAELRSFQGIKHFSSTAKLLAEAK
jgi:hypothetical protein